MDGWAKGRERAQVRGDVLRWRDMGEDEESWWMRCQHFLSPFCWEYTILHTISPPPRRRAVYPSSKDMAFGYTDGVYATIPRTRRTPKRGKATAAAAPRFRLEVLDFVFCLPFPPFNSFETIRYDTPFLLPLGRDLFLRGFSFFTAYELVSCPHGVVFQCT